MPTAKLFFAQSKSGNNPHRMMISRAMRSRGSHLVYQTGGNRLTRHTENNRRFLRFSEDGARAAFYRADTLASVISHSSQYDSQKLWSRR